jgi:hypothetical protein
VSGAHVSWSGTGEADIVLLDGDRVNLLSTTPSAPGSRPSGKLASGTPVRMKVARCKRQDERFLIEARLLDATRDTRAEIQSLLGEPPAPVTPPPPAD